MRFALVALVLAGCGSAPSGFPTESVGFRNPDLPDGGADAADAAPDTHDTHDTGAPEAATCGVHDCTTSADCCPGEKCLAAVLRCVPLCSPSLACPAGWTCDETVWTCFEPCVPSIGDGVCL